MPRSVAKQNINEIEDEASLLSASEPNFDLFVTGPLVFSIGGTGNVYGAVGTQSIRVIDVSGTVSFDPSFNAGMDEIWLTGNPNNWTAVLDDSIVHLSDGDTNVLLPIGRKPLLLFFADGGLLMGADETGEVKIGTQTIGPEPETIVAPFQRILANDYGAVATVNLFVTPGQPVHAYSGGGNDLMIFGTEGIEHLVARLGTFDPSFNRGGDIVTFERSSVGVEVALDDSVVRLTAYNQPKFMDVTLPVGPGGIELRFEDVTATLIYDRATNQVLIGEQVITAEASALAIFG